MMRIGPFKFFEKYVVRDGEDVYLIRWRLVETPWFGVFLHKICRPDHDRHLHDHPWPFVSLVLRGGYVEEVPCDCFGCCLKWIYGVRDTTRSLRRRFSVIRHRAADLHRIHELPNGPAWTLVLIGRRCRDWGFQTETGWVQWQQYLAEKDAPPEPPAPGQCPECRGDGYLYETHRVYRCRECGHVWHAAPAEEAVNDEWSKAVERSWGIPELNTERRTANGHTYAEFSTLDPRVQAKVDEILGGDGGR